MAMRIIGRRFEEESTIEKVLPSCWGASFICINPAGRYFAGRASKLKTSNYPVRRESVPSEGSE